MSSHVVTGMAERDPIARRADRGRVYAPFVSTQSKADTALASIRVGPNRARGILIKGNAGSLQICGFAISCVNSAPRRDS
jgi:hypothetical protein